MPTPAGIYIGQSDLESALSPSTIVALFDDDNDGVADAAPMQSVIDRAEGMVDSFLITERKLPLAAPTDRLVKNAATLYAIAYSFDRHPEYVRSYGERNRQNLEDQATAIMERVVSAKQQLPDETPHEKADNLGGVVYDNGPRTMIDSADGSSNGGDF